MALDRKRLKTVRNSASLKDVSNLFQMLEETFFVYDRLVYHDLIPRRKCQSSPAHISCGTASEVFRSDCREFLHYM